MTSKLVTKNFEIPAAVENHYKDEQEPHMQMRANLEDKMANSWINAQTKKLRWDLTVFLEFRLICYRQFVRAISPQQHKWYQKRVNALSNGDMVAWENCFKEQSTMRRFTEDAIMTTGMKIINLPREYYQKAVEEIKHSKPLLEKMIKAESFVVNQFSDHPVTESKEQVLGATRLQLEGELDAAAKLRRLEPVLSQEQRQGIAHMEKAMIADRILKDFGIHEAHLVKCQKFFQLDKDPALTEMKDKLIEASNKKVEKMRIDLAPTAAELRDMQNQATEQLGAITYNKNGTLTKENFLALETILAKHIFTVISKRLPNIKKARKEACENEEEIRFREASWDHRALLINTHQKSNEWLYSSLKVPKTVYERSKQEYQKVDKETAATLRKVIQDLKVEILHGKDGSKILTREQTLEAINIMADTKLDVMKQANEIQNTPGIFRRPDMDYLQYRLLRNIPLFKEYDLDEQDIMDLTLTHQLIDDPDLAAQRKVHQEQEQKLMEELKVQNLAKKEANQQAYQDRMKQVLEQRKEADALKKKLEENQVAEEDRKKQEDSEFVEVVDKKKGKKSQ